MTESTPASRPIHTAACLIIADEVLNGKIVDTNSGYLAKWCFAKGINLKRVEVIEDDESEIVSTVQRLSERYDFVVTSGGIGPTHDDITYSSIAKAFNLPLVLHAPTVERMKRLGRAEENFDWEVDSPHLAAKLRMAQLPLKGSATNDDRAVLFPLDDLWVPVVVANENVHILPGIPQLFQRLLDGIGPLIASRVANPGSQSHRVLITTTNSESSIAPYLTMLAERVASSGVKVGSYPRWGVENENRNTVSLVGRDLSFLESLAEEVEKRIDGKRISIEEEDQDVVPGDAAKCT